MLFLYKYLDINKLDFVDKCNIHSFFKYGSLQSFNKKLIKNDNYLKFNKFVKKLFYQIAFNEIIKSEYHTYPTKFS
uniref:Uncharacterized protein n=1 Tax=Gloeothece verrucosa (strain PCC 7822) TaxID=497965 RepID=E0U7J9_GLOV7|nr:hypothetical protein Cyan7822_1707 [Gloeothece verrucosa PCC 7822]